MKRLILSIIMISASLAVMAQDVEFTADRPGASTGPATVWRGVIQLEQGIQYDGIGDGYGQFTFSNTLFRYGLFDGVELRLGGDALIHHTYDNWQPAFAGLAVGTKISCFEGRGAIPAISVLADFAIPGTAGNGFETEHLAPSLYLLFENSVNNWLSIGYNVGSEWDGSTPAPTTFVALCLGFSISERLGCFAESYNYFGKAGNSYCADFGLNYMAGERVQLDVAANLDVCNPKQCWAVSLGVAWQLNNPKTK